MKCLTMVFKIFGCEGWAKADFKVLFIRLREAQVDLDSVAQTLFEPGAALRSNEVYATTCSEGSPATCPDGLKG